MVIMIVAIIQRIPRYTYPAILFSYNLIFQDNCDFLQYQFMIFMVSMQTKKEYTCTMIINFAPFHL